MKKVNILFSTTRQWNPGDEFILYGVRNIFDDVGVEYNPVIYNRNPEIRIGRHIVENFPFVGMLQALRWKLAGKGIRRAIQRIFPKGMKKQIDSAVGLASFDTYDNSFKPGLGDYIDLGVFAGTPEWYGSMVKEMYEYLDKKDIPAIFMGVGAGAAFDSWVFSDAERRVIAKAQLITVRDRETLEQMEETRACFMPCPALFFAKVGSEKNVERVRKIGLICAESETVPGNSVSKETFKYIEALYTEVIKRYSGKCEIEFIAHYVDEVSLHRKRYEDHRVHYSYDARDYLGIYEQFDCVIGGRVHGIGAAASLGIPGVGIAHDYRGGALEGFRAEVISCGEEVHAAMKKIEKVINDASAINETLKAHKREAFAEYCERLKKSLPEGWIKEEEQEELAM